MARGWESKSVEQQQEQAVSESASKHRRLTPEQAAQEQRRNGWELSRRKILAELARASNPRHRQMLQAALAELEAKIGRPES
jgi:hypothetical protein